jgi:hypothetical protein
MYDVGLVFSSGLTLVLNIFCSFFSAKTIVHVEAIGFWDWVSQRDSEALSIPYFFW